MARPITALRETHESRPARWFAAEKLTAPQIKIMEGAIAKSLSPDQIEAIEWAVNKIKGLQATAQARPDQREVKRHLNALARADDADLMEMFANADTITRAFMFDHLNTIGELLNPTPEAIRQAAKSAFDVLPKLDPGNMKSWQIFSAKWAIQHWRDCGGADCKAWVSEVNHLERGRKHKQYQSPLVEWSTVFFPQEPQRFGDIQRPALGASRIAKLLAAELTPKESARRN